MSGCKNSFLPPQYPEGKCFIKPGVNGPPEIESKSEGQQ